MLARENRYAKNNSAARKEQQIRQLVPTRWRQRSGPRRGCDRKHKQMRGHMALAQRDPIIAASRTSVTKRQIPGGDGDAVGKSRHPAARPFNILQDRPNSRGAQP